jgi:hypothetical protein
VTWSNSLVYFKSSKNLAPLALLITGTTWAAASTLTIASPIPGSLALARYVASVQRRDLFSESGLVAVVIEASLASPQRNRRIFWSVTRSPERIKKTSTPTKPPRNPGVATWKAPINRTATPRNPSISERNMSFGFTLSARSFGDLGGVEMTKSGPSH